MERFVAAAVALYWSLGELVVKEYRRGKHDDNVPKIIELRRENQARGTCSLLKQSKVYVWF